MQRTSNSLTDQKAIAGREYRTTKLPPDRALRLLNTLSKVVGGPIGNAMGAFASGADLDNEQAAIIEKVRNVDGDSLGSAITNLFAGIESEDLPRLLGKIFSETKLKVTGSNGDVWTSIDLNRDFAGDRLFDVFDLAAWVINVNYGVFLARLKKFAKANGASLLEQKADQENNEKSND